MGGSDQRVDYSRAENLSLDVLLTALAYSRDGALEEPVSL